MILIKGSGVIGKTCIVAHYTIELVEETQDSFTIAILCHAYEFGLFILIR